MGFIAKFRVTSPLLQETMQAIPDMTLEMEDLQVLEGRLPKYIFWADDVEIEALEEALEIDSTVADFVFLTKVGTRPLYRVTFTEAIRDRLAYPTASKFDIVYLSLVQSGGESTIRAQVPSRDALKAHREAFRERDIPFTLNRLYREASGSGDSRYDLTERQREAMVLAYESGYFGSTRDCSLEEMADQLDISRQALAGRLRRGHERLIENTLA